MSTLTLSVNAPKLLKHFASGRDVEVRKIRPSLELAPGGCWQSDLFRLAGLYWRIPISEGYGRRLRFLVWDDHNGKLIGLLALGDAVFNLRERDQLIGWDHERRAEALVNLMDAYVLGALPPYNAILGGKLAGLSCIAHSGYAELMFLEEFHQQVADFTVIVNDEDMRRLVHGPMIQTIRSKGQG